MKKILIAGAGKSSSALIKYLLDQSVENNWKVTIIDSNLDTIRAKTENHENAIPLAIDIMDVNLRQNAVKNSDIVLSILPPDLHFLLAEDCLQFEKHLITSSYTSDKIQALDEKAKAKNLLFMNEMGADPGIDHMSTAKIIDEIHEQGGKVVSFRSFCGGLVSKESDTNPWHYKISWNPHNIVHAGKSGAMWLEDGIEKQLDYEELYNPEKKVIINNDEYGYYPNRDSLHYKNLFNLNDVKTFERATLRHPAFIDAWQYIIKLNLTKSDMKYDTNNISFASWVLKQNNAKSLPELLRSIKLSRSSKAYNNLYWLGIFDLHNICIGEATSAEILQNIIERKWRLQPRDKDLLVMHHETKYLKNNEIVEHHSSMEVEGDNMIISAMAKCVGLPMAILAHKILDGQIDTKKINGVRIPKDKEIYNLVLPELEKLNIKFVEKELVLH